MTGLPCSIALMVLGAVGIFGIVLVAMGKQKGEAAVNSLELYPTGPIDRDDPILWGLVRDEEPLHPGLPRVRHRIVLTAPNQGPVVAAVLSHVPQIWLGESQRPAGHIGRPDLRGHRERTRGRTR
ncbi:hypothetical protein SAZ11_36355 [Streptomyces sp. FXJ1.4098]|uniref:hypothetical protein n=1 Tax=Streptomyces sp. NPDC020845 TaxID=3365096 RepID=UPI00299B99B8|nr:hypothetical protein [Streptomyces sp. FXJ1.4098]